MNFKSNDVNGNLHMHISFPFLAPASAAPETSLKCKQKGIKTKQDSFSVVSFLPTIVVTAS